jgi:hypothetical protein
MKHADVPMTNPSLFINPFRLKSLAKKEMGPAFRNKDV